MADRRSLDLDSSLDAQGEIADYEVVGGKVHWQVEGPLGSARQCLQQAWAEGDS